MVRSLWKRTLVTTFAWAGMAWGQSMPSLPSTQPAKPTETSERLVTLQESGKPAQKCRILKNWKTAEGATAYKVQALDSGEIMTIVENGPATTVPGSREGTRKQALATRIFHWGRDGTPPAGTPLPPDEPVRTVASAPDRRSASTIPTPVLPPPQNPEPRPPAPVATSPNAKTSKETPKSKSDTGSTAANRPVGPAQPTEWRQSWGKANDHKSQVTAKSASSTSDKQTSSIPILPEKPGKPVDPLQTPDQYTKVAGVEKVPAEKGDSSRLPIVMPLREMKSVPLDGEVISSTVISEQVVPVEQGPPVLMGSRSVLAASEVQPGGVRYIPVPIVTVPDVNHPPVPPAPPPPPFPQPGATRGASVANAFTPAQSNRAFAPAPPAPDATMANAFTAPPSRDLIAKSTNAFNANPSGMSGTGSQNSAPMPGPNLQQLFATLRDSLYPSQREWAAEGLATINWRAHPQVIQALLTAAKEDPAPTVRASCIHCLAKMNVNTMPVVTTVGSLKMDADPRVRMEAEQALAVLGSNQPAYLPPAIQPASGTDLHK